MSTMYEKLILSLNSRPDSFFFLVNILEPCSSGRGLNASLWGGIPIKILPNYGSIKILFWQSTDWNHSLEWYFKVQKKLKIAKSYGLCKPVGSTGDGLNLTNIMSFFFRMSWEHCWKSSQNFLPLSSTFLPYHRQLPFLNPISSFTIIIILNLNDIEREDFWKHCGERWKCWKPAFSPFLTMFSTHTETIFSFPVTFILPFANAFNLDQSKKCVVW